jgi:hypothetical protein
MIDHTCRHSTGRAGVATQRAFALLIALLVMGILTWPAPGSAGQEGKAQPKDSPQQPSAPDPGEPKGSQKPQPDDPPDKPVEPPVGVPTPQPPQAAQAPPRFQFKIDPKTPVKDLLPVPPTVKKLSGPVLIENPAHAPELELQVPLARDLESLEATKKTAHTIAKINHLNSKKTDGFIEALIRERQDLRGLPFAMGDACRTKGERNREFAQAVGTVRSALGNGGVVGAAALRPQLGLLGGQGGPGLGALGGLGGTRLGAGAGLKPPAPAAPVPQPVPPPNAGEVQEVTPAETFWDQYLAACAQEDKALARVDRERREHVTVARVAALMQVLAPEAPSMRLGLVKHLASISHVEATRALARLAIFSAEDDIRLAAVDALKVRREKDYTTILLDGLRYPLPAVAKRASEAIVKLERTDLVPQLIGVLEDADPRAPVVKETGDKKVPAVRELVRVNHHRSCLMCHAPANTGTVSQETLTAPVPVPSEPLPSPGEGYQTPNASPDILVRLDVTYLRQDFSMLLAVADANPWPEMQRFDFLVRTRELNEDEAASYQKAFEKKERGRLSPYHRVALAALRELTGKDTEPTPEAWRKLLELPEKQEGKTAIK